MSRFAKLFILMLVAFSVSLICVKGVLTTENTQISETQTEWVATQDALQ